MTPVCLSCPILHSCKHKHTQPIKCPHKPAHIGTNLSTAISNLGRKRIAVVGDGENFRKMSRDEHALRAGVCEGWE